MSDTPKFQASQVLNNVRITAPDGSVLVEFPIGLDSYTAAHHVADALTAAIPPAPQPKKAAPKPAEDDAPVTAPARGAK